MSDRGNDHTDTDDDASDDDNDENNGGDAVCTIRNADKSTPNSRMQQKQSFSFRCMDNRKRCIMNFSPPLSPKNINGENCTTGNYSCRTSNDETLKTCCPRSVTKFENDYDTNTLNFTKKLKAYCKLYCRQESPGNSGKLRCEYIGCNFQTLYPGSCDQPSETKATSNAGAVVGPVVAVLLVSVIAAVLALWWRKRRRTREESAGADKTIQGTSGNPGVIVNASFDPKGGAERVAVPERNSEYNYTYIDNASSNVPKTAPNADVEDSVYHELDDDINRKLPPAPVGNADNSSFTARKDDTTSLEASVRNGNSSAQGLTKSEFSFARGLPAGDTVELSSAVVSQMGHVYSCLNPSTDAEYTPLSQTSGDSDQSPSASTQDGQGGQYFVLEEEAAGESKQPKGEGKYFILEEEANIKSHKQTGDTQYFILEEEKETTHSNKEQTTGGQYFILEQEASTAEEPSEATGGSKSPKQAPENDGDKEYSHLDRSGRGGKPTGVKSEYSTLGST